MTVGWKKGKIFFQGSVAILIRIAALPSSTRFLVFLVYTAKINNIRFALINRFGTDFFYIPYFFIPFRGRKDGF